MENDRVALAAGTGRWQATPEGDAARHLVAAEWKLRVAHLRAETASGMWDRRRASRELDNARNLHAHAQQHWETIGEPVADRLDQQIHTTRQRLAELRRDNLFNRQWHTEHPEITRAINDKTQQLHRLEAEPASEALGDPPDVGQPDRGADPLDRALDDLAAVNNALDRLPPGRHPAIELPPHHPGIDPPARDVGLGL